ncbi:hypothetical protein [Bacillus wiedmannii]|uniref:hypothetical protein n=1 Tax=Bacillus wiedmannii TaxID=1890302 RepID=UPI000BEFE59C|nr:hypothetical protein [Bacillus wiedmannii]PEN61607.1 hypothetical protein CN576_21470 [Bacillus wiedmannii]
MIGNDEWKRYVFSLDIEKGKKVKNIEFGAVVEDMTGKLQMTDLQFQEGKMISANIPATQDILKPVEFGIDEFEFMNTVENAYKKGVQPVIHQNVKNRFYNILSRGHNVLAIPNVFHEDYTFPLVTSGLDIELYAKEDFDLLRIRTNDGGHVPDRHYKGIPQLEHHPLNYQYTREFYFDGGKAGEKIDLKATIRAARVGERDIPLKKREILINGYPMQIDRQRFMLAPSGSFRIGIEFYKQVEETFEDDSGDEKTVKYLKDVGIGYYGVAELNQWTYGVSKL